jgi:hypothetical protein
MKRFRLPILINILGLLISLSAFGILHFRFQDNLTIIVENIVTISIFIVIISTIWVDILALLPPRDFGWQSAIQRCLVIVMSNIAPITLAVTAWLMNLGEGEGDALGVVIVVFMIPTAIFAGLCILAIVAIVFRELSRQRRDTLGTPVADLGPGPDAAKP